MISQRHCHILFLAHLCAACALLASTAARASDLAPIAAPGNHKTATIGGATFTYPPGERPFAEEIASSYTFPIRLLDQKSFDAQMDRWKQHDLPLMAKRLGLPQPTEAMNTTFEQFRDFCKPTIEETIDEVRINTVAGLRDATAAGLKIEGLSYNPDTKALGIAPYIGIERAGPGDARKKFRVMPVVLPDPLPDDLAARMRIFNATLRDMRWRLDEAIYNAYCGRLYQITRPEIIATVNQSRFPLWIMEGMTNAIPLLVIHSHNPGLTYEQILASRGAQPPPDFKNIAAGINPDIWVTTRSQAAPPPKPEMDSYYYLSLLIVLDAIQQNGEDWLPAFFTRLRKENSPALNMAVLYKIYSEVTGGKDLHDSVTRVKDNLAGNPASPAAPPTLLPPPPATN